MGSSWCYRVEFAKHGVDTAFVYCVLFAWLATIGSWEIDEYQAFDYVLWQVAWKKIQ